VLGRAALAAFTGWEAGWLPTAYERFEASNGLRQVTLADGSQVELNLGTELVYADYKDQRRVTLSKGEAFSRSAMTAPIRLSSRPVKDRCA